MVKDETLNELEIWLCNIATHSQDDNESKNALELLRLFFDKTYMYCSDCDYLVVKEKYCCLNKINLQEK